MGDDNGGYTPVVVADGLIDATVWGGSLLTLRNGPTGYFVRDEQLQRNYGVDTPSGAEAFCLAVSGQMLVVGGHRIIESETVQLKSGELYTKLVSQAGAEAVRLSRQPSAPAQPTGFSFRPASHRPLLLASSNGREWKQIEFSSDPLPGGTVGAILQSEGVVAVLRYIDSGDTDSGAAVEFASLGGALRGEFQKQHQALPIPHGGLWGAFEGPSGGLVIAYGSDGARARSVTGVDAFSLPSDEQLLGVHYTKDGYIVAVKGADGSRVRKVFGSSGSPTVRAFRPDELIRHGVSPEVVLSSTEGFAKSEAYKPQRRTEVS